MRLKSTNILYLLLFTFMLCMTGCKDIKDIRVTSVQVESLSPRGFKSMDVFLSVGVDNPAKQVKVSEIEGDLMSSGKVIGKLAVDPFVLAAKSSEVYGLKANVALAQGAGLKELMILASPGGLDGCTLDISAKAAYGKGAAMPLKFKDIPLKELLDKLENEQN